MAADGVEEDIGGEDQVVVRFDVIAGNIEFWIASTRPEDTLLGIILATGQVLQAKEWGNGSSLAQIDLDGVVLPPAISRLDGHEVQDEAADDPFPGQALANL